jgi:hypothetical protein
MIQVHELTRAITAVAILVFHMLPRFGLWVHDSEVDTR